MAYTASTDDVVDVGLDLLNVSQPFSSTVKQINTSLPNDTVPQATVPGQDLELFEDISEASITLMSCSACGYCLCSASSIVANCSMCQQ